MTEVSLFFSTNITAMMSRKNTDKKNKLFDFVVFGTVALLPKMSEWTGVQEKGILELVQMHS